ncbi:hypothetical protein FOFC_03875 [Fusarium oxysporum]|nr:hypothetical protein FOFC_03875 [Fusarium oxysporum]
MHSPELDPGKPQNPGISNPQVMVADLKRDST